MVRGWDGAEENSEKAFGGSSSETAHYTNSEKVGLKLNIQKTKIMASGPITS